jgi:hypothetical protein
MFKRILHRNRTQRLCVIVLAVIIVLLIAYLALLVFADYASDPSAWVFCRMGWYDPERRTPHYTQVFVFPWVDHPCAGVPPCGDPPVYGAGPPCDRLPTPAPP